MAGCALVLEGGSMRGMFTAGVLDVLAENGLTGFSHIYGVSAGALAAVIYKAGQHGRFCRDVLAFRGNPNFMSIWSLITKFDIVGQNFLHEKVNLVYDPFDFDYFNSNPVPLTVVCADVVFGTPVYLPVNDLPKDRKAVVATTSLPCVSEIVNYHDRRLLDGGFVDAVPYQRALDDGADRVLCILTRPRDFVMDHPYRLLPVGEQLYKDFPLYLNALKTRPERYNAQRKRLWDLEAEGTCEVLAPDGSVHVGMLDTDGTSMLELYIQGRKEAERRLDQIRDFLEG